MATIRADAAGAGTPGQATERLDLTTSPGRGQQCESLLTDEGTEQQRN